MDPNEYQQIIKSKRVLEYRTLIVTFDELEKLGDLRLMKELQRTLANNKIEKPKFHGKIDGKDTNYYRIDLEDDDIESIVSMFGNKEVSSLGPNYETTPAASLYAAILDNWNRIILD